MLFQNANFCAASDSNVITFKEIQFLTFHQKKISLRSSMLVISLQRLPIFGGMVAITSGSILSTFSYAF